LRISGKYLNRRIGRNQAQIKIANYNITDGKSTNTQIKGAKKGMATVDTIG
jgi:hypothetical protein